MKHFLRIAVIFSIMSALSCRVYPETDGLIDWERVSRPGMDDVIVYDTREEAEAAGGGWFVTMNDTFDDNRLPEHWTTSPHGLRWKSQSSLHPEYANYWCPALMSVKNGMVEILSESREDHVCPDGICPKAANFTSGIETRRIPQGASTQGEADELLFSQAFGYFETRVQVPAVPGMWSAFWLQSSHQRKVGNGGEDGTEIDIYESAFLKQYNRSENIGLTGHALLWDGYGANGKIEDFVSGVVGNLYEGFHTYGLKWTPTEYIFYVDGQPTWMTDAGGVSKVREFLRLTCEIDAGDQWGPHGQRIGRFSYDKDEPPVFYIDYVKVWQHTDYLSSIRVDSEFAGEKDTATN